MQHPEAATGESLDRLPGYQSILVASDSSDHANQAVREAIGLAGCWQGQVTGAHVYAAAMHDLRFRQMEGGLPERFRQESELERQREVHDDLITRGLSIITDSYLDRAEALCAEADIRFRRRALEGKNYRQLVNEANSGEYDLLVIGALGLGAVGAGRLGSVCERVARRCKIDTLVIKQTNTEIRSGPIAVAIDGSPRAYGGLMTALALAAQWQVPVHVLAAFDPYYHYVAFNRIADVLSEEAGKVFRFQEQEKLHEEIIDSGLARIYQGHLDVATRMAADFDTEINTELLAGKPYDVIARHLRKLSPGLLVVGKLGIHADPELDIGGNAEQLLRDVDCAVLLGQRCHTPQVDLLASVTTSWSTEAEQRMERVPEFVRPMARMAILRYAQEQGHTVITAGIVEQATRQLMPAHAEQAMGEIVAAYDSRQATDADRNGLDLPWDDAATELLASKVDDASVRANLHLRIEKLARSESATRVEARHAQALLTDRADPATTAPLHWQAAALARLARVPEGFMRDLSRQRVEQYARDRGQATVNLETAEAGLAVARERMQGDLKARQDETGVTPTTEGGRCPFANLREPSDAATGSSRSPRAATPPWHEDAEQLLNGVPAGYCQDMTRGAIEAIATQRAAPVIDATLVQSVLSVFAAGSSGTTPTLPWDAAAEARIERAPDMIRGMLIREIEDWVRRRQGTRVDEDSVEAVKQQWRERGVFHLDPQDVRGR